MNSQAIQNNDQIFKNSFFSNNFNSGMDKFFHTAEEVSQRYQTFKENFYERQNFYLNYFYYFFGEHYESIINNVNFFHFATEAIILELLKILKIDESEDPSNKDQNFSKFLTFVVDSKNFYENLRILTGSCYLYDPATKLSEMKLATLFLKNFHLIKHELKIENFENLKSTLILICHLSASSTLYELNLLAPIDNKNYDTKLFFTSFEEMKNLNTNIILHNYIKIVKKNLNTNLDIIKQKNILNILKMFYFYTKTSYEDYMFDIELFYDHSTSLFEKIKKISSQGAEKFEKLNSDIQNYMKGSKTFENLKIFYASITDNVTQKTEIVKTKFYSFKTWINDSIKFAPNLFNEKLEISKIFLYNKILVPSKNCMVLYTDKCVTFLIMNLSNAKTAFLQISNYFLDKSDLFMSNLGKKINEKELSVKFLVDDKVNFIKIDIDNSVLLINPENFKQYVQDVYTRLQACMFEFYEKSKNYLLNRYKNFLGDEEKSF
jgi:hypothetical protein